MGDALINLKTDQALLNKLGTAKAPSRSEVESQRVSFVYGLLDEKAHMTKEQVKRYVEEAA